MPVVATSSASGLRRRAHVLLDVMRGDVAEAIDALAWGGNPAADALIEQAGSRGRARDALMDAVRERADMREAG